MAAESTDITTRDVKAGRDVIIGSPARPKEPPFYKYDSTPARLREIAWFIFAVGLYVYGAFYPPEFSLVKNTPTWADVGGCVRSLVRMRFRVEEARTGEPVTVARISSQFRSKKIEKNADENGAIELLFLSEELDRNVLTVTVKADGFETKRLEVPMGVCSSNQSSLVTRVQLIRSNVVLLKVEATPSLATYMTSFLSFTKELLQKKGYEVVAIGPAAHVMEVRLKESAKKESEGCALEGIYRIDIERHQLPRQSHSASESIGCPIILSEVARLITQQVVF